MSNPATAFTTLVPGFDFLQNLVKNASAAMPGVGQWIAPTIDPAELEKRIADLRTVQFWLEQNARMLAATIQALEVQRMTLSTLKTMNLSLGDLAESMKIRLPEPAPEAAAPPPPPAAPPEPPPEPPPSASAPAAAPSPGVVDPMQWWGALTQQFTQLAASAMQESAGDAARSLAGAMVKQGLDAAGDTFRQAAAVPASVAQSAVSVAKSLSGSAAAAPARPAAKRSASAKRGAATKAAQARRGAKAPAAR